MTTLFMMLTLMSQSVDDDRPVIRLEEMTIQGTVRKPTAIEIQGSTLDKKIEEAALKSLIRLEKRLLNYRPLPFKP